MMTEYLNIALAIVEQLTARDWALMAAFLFILVMCLRTLRLLRKKPAHQAGAQATAVPVVEPTQVAQEPARQPRRPAPAKRVHAVAPAPKPAPAAQPPRTKARVNSVKPAPQSAPSNVAQALSKVNFSAKPMMPWEQYCLLRDIEAFLIDQGAGHRLFSHVQLSDAFGVNTAHMSDELGDAVERALAPFRVDFLILDRQGVPTLALHMAPANPVLETVFDKAGVPLLVLPADYSWMTIESQLARHLGDALQPLRHAG